MLTSVTARDEAAADDLVTVQLDSRFLPIRNGDCAVPLQERARDCGSTFAVNWVSWGIGVLNPSGAGPRAMSVDPTPPLRWNMVVAANDPPVNVRVVGETVPTPGLELLTVSVTETPGAKA